MPADAVVSPCIIQQGNQASLYPPFGTPDDWKNVCAGRRLDEALQYLHRRLKQGTPLSRNFAYYLVQGSSKKRDLAVGRVIYSMICNSSLDLVPALGDPLIRLFAFHGLLSEASSVFHNITNPNSYTWHAIISAHIAHQQHEKSLSLYSSMLFMGFDPSKFMLSYVLKACACLDNLDQGMVVHNQIIECQLDSDVVIGSALIGFYSKCGTLEEAQYIFDILPSKNIVTWNTMIAGWAQHGDGFLAWELFQRMQQEKLKPDEFTFSCVLKACGIMGSLNRGEMVHDMIIQRGMVIDTVLGNAMIDMCAKCNDLKKAHGVFRNMRNHNVVSWNTIILAHTNLGCGLEAIGLFEKMQEECIRPNRVTFLSVLKACSSIIAMTEGKWLHNQTILCGLATDVEIGSILVVMYANCGSFSDACGVFDNLSDRDDVLWSTMISASVQHGHYSMALGLFLEMEEKKIKQDKVTFLCVLKACSSMRELNQGRNIHQQILYYGLVFDLLIRNSLIDMYNKCGRLDEAQKLFEDFPDRNVASWDSMITGYAYAELWFPTLEIFEKMLLEDCDPDKVSFLCALKASGNIGAIVQGRIIHDMINRKGYEGDIEIGNCLIDMYASCGNLLEAFGVFKLLPIQGSAAWGALISGYAQQGNWNLANRYLEKMQRQGLNPNDVIYTSMLSACCVAGQIDEGHQQFALIAKNSIPTIEHYNCMTDLLGRAGYLYQAERLLRSIPISLDVFGWMSLLTSCRKYGNVHLGKQCYEEIMQLDPDNSSALCLILDLLTDFDLEHTYIDRKRIKQCLSEDIWESNHCYCLRLSTTL